MLRAICRAEWVTYAATSSAQWQFTANLGAGRLCIGTLWHFARERPKPVALVKNLMIWRNGHSISIAPEILDAGDVVVEILNDYNEWLEGSSLRPRERREDD